MFQPLECVISFSKVYLWDLGLKFGYVLAALRRKNGAAQLDPQHREYFLLPVPRLGYGLATLQRPNTQLRSYTIRVWSYETLLCVKQSLTGIYQSKPPKKV